MRRRLVTLGLLGLVCGLAPAAVASAADSVQTAANLEPVEGGFRLKGTHGYSIGVIAYAEFHARKGSIAFIVSRRGATAYYSTTATVTADAIRANLGSLGRVNVVRHPSGLTKKVRVRCLGRRPLAYEAATYEGVIEFNGEHRYTRARESRVPQLPGWLVFAGHGPCGGGSGESIGTGQPGARLRGISFAHDRGLTFQVNKNGRRERTLFTASVKELRHGVYIRRELSGKAGPGAFRYDPSLKAATLSPPSPFSGSASLRRSKNLLSPTWTGNLKLDFPGRQALPLTGPGLHVSLVHARFSNSPTAEFGI
ncbi:MAG TPA: hypothetical protein VIE39_03840 [Thermoanaerobaculia bacterium]